MKRLITFVLLLTLTLSLAACAASRPGINDQPVFDVKALEQQFAADFAKLNGYDEAPFTYFHYLGTDNGYHIVWYYIPTDLCALPQTVKIRGYEFVTGGGWNLAAYRNGEIIVLSLAVREGLISEEALAKASRRYIEIKNATE